MTSKINQKGALFLELISLAAVFVALATIYPFILLYSILFED
tara:strand:- start:685 stop:810 length:126 start_codon:yes stop_codon:yes gene_type:complete